LIPKQVCALYDYLHKSPVISHRKQLTKIAFFLTLLSDLTKPHEWYPLARLDKRKVRQRGPTHFH